MYYKMKRKKIARLHTMHIKQLLILLFNIAKGVAWFLLVGSDNGLRSLLGFSPLLRAKARPARPNGLTVQEKIGVRITASSLSLSDPTDESVRLENLWLYHPFHEQYNLAICLRRLVNLRGKLKSIGISPTDCRLIRRSVPSSAINPEIRSLFNYFAADRTLQQMEGSHLIDRLICLDDNYQFWELWNDQRNMEDLREELLRANGIRPAPPARSVRMIVFIRRQDYDQQKKSSKRKVILRKIANEEEIINALSSRFPDIRVRAVRFEKMSLAEQLGCVNAADILIGMHGAGLGHALLMKPNSGLLEIFPLHFAFPYTFYTFYVLAAARSLHYTRLLQILPWREHASADFKRVKRRDPAFIHSAEPFFYTGMLGDYAAISPVSVIRKTGILMKGIRRTART